MPSRPGDEFTSITTGPALGTQHVNTRNIKPHALCGFECGCFFCGRKLRY